MIFPYKSLYDRLTNSRLKELGFERRATFGVLEYIHHESGISVGSQASIMRFDSFARVWYGEKEVKFVHELNEAIKEKNEKDLKRYYADKKDNSN